MRAYLVFLVVLGVCASMKTEPPGGLLDALQIRGTWIGLDNSGERWWRLQLDDGRVGRGGIAAGGGVARYRITDWSSAAAGRVRVDLVRGDDATALDRMPKSIRLDGKSDGVRLRMMHGKSEIVFWREDRLIAARNRLKKGMEAK